MLMIISSSKERTVNLQCELFIEICKMSPFDISKQLLIISKKLGDTLYDIFKHFCNSHKNNDIS